MVWKSGFPFIRVAEGPTPMAGAVASGAIRTEVAFQAQTIDQLREML